MIRVHSNTDTVCNSHLLGSHLFRQHVRTYMLPICYLKTLPTAPNETISASMWVIPTCSWAIAAVLSRLCQLSQGREQGFAKNVHMKGFRYSSHSLWAFNVVFTHRLYKPTGPKCYRKGVIKAELVCFPFDSRRHTSHARTYLLNCLIPLILMIVDRKA